MFDQISFFDAPLYKIDKPIRLIELFAGIGSQANCEEWEKFENFFRDMGVRPEGTTLDRIDPRGNYEPSNCRWADIITQENNRRNNRKFEYDGEKLTLPQIARKYGISRSNLANKIYIQKMDVVEAVDYLRGVMTYR